MCGFCRPHAAHGHGPASSRDHSDVALEKLIQQILNQKIEERREKCATLWNDAIVPLVWGHFSKVFVILKQMDALRMIELDEPDNVWFKLLETVVDMQIDSLELGVGYAEEEFRQGPHGWIYVRACLPQQ